MGFICTIYIHCLYWCMSLMLVWSIEHISGQPAWVPGKPGLHNETLSWKTKKKKKFVYSHSIKALSDSKEFFGNIFFISLIVEVNVNSMTKLLECLKKWLSWQEIRYYIMDLVTLHLIFEVLVISYVVNHLGEDLNHFCWSYLAAGVWDFLVQL